VERTAQAFGVLGNVFVLIVQAIVLAWLLAAAPAALQLAVAPLTSPAPDTLAAPIRQQLVAEGHRVSLGATTLEFWWVSALPIAGGGPPEWSKVAEGALVGVIRVSGSFKEIRGKTVSPGVYTLRLGLQPQNGDHLGVSPFREYLLLSPASADQDPKPLGFDASVALSKLTVGTSHPAALSLDPPLSTAAPLSAYKTELDHQGVAFQVKTSPSGSLTFGLVLVGLIEH
jgi:hypothetical protein